MRYARYRHSVLALKRLGERQLVETRASPTRYRWIIAAMLALAAMLNYLDRQTLSLMASVVQVDLDIDDAGYALLVNAFLAAYMIGGLLSAWLVDRFGARGAMALFVAWWSFASALSGVAANVWHLASTRFALGIAEAGGWIASPKLVQEWFPQNERALAIGIYSSAAHFGAALAPIVVTTMLLSVGWRWTFVATGLVGLLWLALWLLLSRPGRRDNLASRPSGVTGERAEPKGIPHPASPTGDRRAWVAVLRTQPVWALAAANALTNPVWFFYLFWFPKYLTQERGLSIVELGQLSWIVYAAAGVGSVLGGIASGVLVRRGRAAASARVAVMALVALVAPVGALNALAPPVGVSLALGAVVALAHTAWVTNQTALFVDLYAGHQIGKAMAVSGLVSGIVTMGSTYLVGQLVSTITYRPMFLVIAFAYPLGLICARYAIRRPPEAGAAASVPA